MSSEKSGPPSVQSIPKGSEWEERCRRFFAQDPGWATVAVEYPPGAPYSWVRGNSGAPSPLPCGEIPLKSIGGLTTLGTPPGSEEWWGLMAGLSVLRGMVVEQRGISYAEAKSQVLDLLDARSALDAAERSAVLIEPEASEHRRSTEQIRVRLHGLFNEVVGLLSQVDRWARRSLRSEAAARAMVDELLRAHESLSSHKASHHTSEYFNSILADLMAALVEAPDWQNRAIAAEDRLETAEYLLGGLRSAVRELAGPNATCLNDVRNRMDTLEGERLAAEQRRDEIAAHVLQMRELLGGLRTFEMPEDVEMMHHSIMASPRSAETERLAQECIDVQVRKAYSGLVTTHAARETELLEKLGRAEKRAYSITRALEARDRTIEWWSDSAMERSKKLEKAEHERDFFKKSALASGITLVLVALLLAAIASGLLHSA